jgi:hypothetical protein
VLWLDDEPLALDVEEERRFRELLPYAELLRDAPEVAVVGDTDVGICEQLPSAAAMHNNTMCSNRTRLMARSAGQ